MSQNAITFKDDWKYRTTEKIKDLVGKNEFRHFTVVFIDGYLSHIEYSSEEQLQRLEQKAKEFSNLFLGKLRFRLYVFWRHFPRTIGYLSVRDTSVYILYHNIDDDALIKEFAEKLYKECNCPIEVNFKPYTESTTSANDII